jgi:hypothetical protein
MLWAKCSIALLTFCVCWTCSAATHHRYECPSPLVDGKFKRSIWRVNVYDGPPENMASLIVWESLNHVDVYLVCTYKATILRRRRTTPARDFLLSRAPRVSITGTWR